MLRFGKLALDLDSRVVRLDGEISHLEPQAFDVLRYLVDNRERVVPQVELLDEIWGDQFVSAAALTTRIKEIRRAVGDDGRTQAVIKNVRARGYQFVAKAQGDEAEPSSGRRPLPRAPHLIGRATELDDAKAQIGRSPLVTLTGPGGVGKTSLALNIASELASEFPDGAVFVDLAPIEDEGAVVSGLRQAVGSTAPAADVQLFAAGLAILDGLVILDNCEHVIETVAGVVDRVLSVGGPVRFLATSRERLALPDERVVPVGPLEPIDARALFLERATQVHPSFELRPEDKPLVDRMMESLDRLPLTVEMAAGRTSALGLEDLVSLVDGGAAILSASSRGATERHQTVTDLVRWSTELLAPKQQRLLADLSVFAGGVEVDDVVGVLSVDGADRARIVDGLASLVDRSLVSMSRDGSRSTYRLLETTKQFARTLARSNEMARRHAEWFADAADDADRDLRNARESTGDARFRQLFSELRAAHGWARQNDLDLACRLTGGVTMYAHTRMRSEPAQWAEELLGQLPEDHSERPVLLALLAGNAAHRGDTERAAVLTSECFSIGVTGRTEASVVSSAADHTLFTADFEATHRHCDRLMELGESESDWYHWAFGLSGRALALVYAGEHEAALAALDAVAIPPGLSPSADAWLRFASGEALGAAGRRDEAAREYERGIAAAETVDGQYALSILKMGMVSNLAQLEDAESAKPLLRQTLAEFQRDGVITHAVVTMRNIVDLFLRTEEDEHAMTVLGGLSTDEITAIFGPRDEEVSMRRAVAVGRRDPAQVDHWLAEGKRMTIAETIRYALQLLDDGQDG